MRWGEISKIWVLLWSRTVCLWSMDCTQVNLTHVSLNMRCNLSHFYGALIRTELSHSTTRGRWKSIDWSIYELLYSVYTVHFCDQTETQRWKLKSPRGVIGELWDFKHFTLPRVLECKLIPGITIKGERRTCIWRSRVKKALLMKTEWRKDKVQRGNPLFKCQAVGAILSPALISSFLLPSWLRFLTFVCPSWPFACLCRWVWLNTCQVATDIHHPWFGEVVHTCVTPQEGKDACWRNSTAWRKYEFNPFEICFHTWFGLCGFTARVWVFKSQPACFWVCRFPSGSCTVILFLLFLSS